MTVRLQEFSQPRFPLWLQRAEAKARPPSRADDAWFAFVGKYCRVTPFGHSSLITRHVEQSSLARTPATHYAAITLPLARRSSSSTENATPFQRTLIRPEELGRPSVSMTACAG